MSYTEEDIDMRKYIPLAVVILVLVAVPMTLMAMSHGSGEKEMAAQPVDLEAAKVTFEETCSKCHNINRPLGKKKDQAGWETPGSPPRICWWPWSIPSVIF